MYVHITKKGVERKRGKKERRKEKKKEEKNKRPLVFFLFFLFFLFSFFLLSFFSTFCITMYYNPPAGIAISLPIHRAHGIVTCNPHISGQIANLVIWYRDIVCTLLFFKKKLAGGEGKGAPIKLNQPYLK